MLVFISGETAALQRMLARPTLCREAWKMRSFAGFGSTSHENVIKPCRALSCRDPVNFVVVRPKRHGSLANHAKLHLFPASRSRRRSKGRGRHRGRNGRQTLVQFSGEGRPPGRRLKQREGRRRLRRVLSWRSLPGSRERPAVATMVANRASNAARTLGLDAANRRDTYSVFSATCKDTLTHRDYAQCVETKMFLGWDRQRSWWYCTGMLNGGKFRVTAENRNR